MHSTEELKKLYIASKTEISARLNEFKKLRGASDEKIFYELCYCVLTAHGSARAGRGAQARLEKNGFWHVGDIGDCLDGVRYRNNKKLFLLNNRANIISDSLNLREFLEGDGFLVRNKVANDSMYFKGLGMKAASQFLRNVGVSDLAILDRHILKSLKDYGVIKEIPSSITKNVYIEIEGKMQGFSKGIDVPMDALDILFWTGMSGE
ncbi:MAG: DNA lyase, partial [Candidatus Aenigmarchaeota archaeon]|nr:DNA lyase [Candidatus Aenigmarchaeota archaeon]